MNESTGDQWSHLLSCLGEDQAAAEREYVSIRETLLRIFRWRRSDDPEGLADETIARVARYLFDRDERISSPRKVTMFGLTAINVWREANRRDRRRNRIEAQYQKLFGPTDPAILEEERRHIDQGYEAIEAMSDDDRKLVLSYYRGSGQARIDHRRRMALRLGVSQNALRLRAYKIRKRLEGTMHG